MINLTPGVQVRAIVFVGWDCGDLLGAIVCEPDEPWKAVWRFRHDDEEAGEDDRRNWYEAKAGAGEGPDDLVRTLRVAAAISGSHFGQSQGLTDFDWIDVYGNGADAIAMIQDRPWCQVRSMEMAKA